jgi:hypothetical protein
LAALGCVDLIVLMADLTPHRLLVTICPHILAKGATTGEIAAAELIAAIGGRTVRVDCLVPGVSTTASLIKQLFLPDRWLNWTSRSATICAGLFDAMLIGGSYDLLRRLDRSLGAGSADKPGGTFWPCNRRTDLG